MTVDWTEFRDRLRATLVELTDRSFLIVSSPRGATVGYVQFAGGSEALSAEASGPEFAAGAAAHADDDPVLLSAGWSPPNRPQPNWSFELALPALTTEYAELADRCVIALRDVFHVSDAAALTYQAWREPEEQPPGVTWSPERFDQLDPGENPLSLPSLGLQRVV